MKRYLKITLLMIVIMMLGMGITYAAEATLNMNSSKSEVKKGDTFSIDVIINCETGIEALDSTLEYNDTQIELTGISEGTNYKDFSEKNDETGEYKLSSLFWISADAPTTATIATLNFKVLSDVKAGDKIGITLSDIEINDSANKWIELDSKKATVTVISDSQGEQDGGNNNNNNNNNNNSSGKDNTQASGKLTYAGLENFTFIIIVSVTIGIFSYIKYLNYKKM